MRATFSDPQGPAGWRALPHLGAIAAFVLACAALDGAVAWVFALLALAGVNAAGILPLRQRRARIVQLETRPGVVAVRGAGTRSQRIHTKDVVGATTSRTRDGVMITLGHAKRDQPVTIEVPTDAEANAVRQALGIGHGGFGTIAWRSIPAPTATSGFAGHVLALAVTLLCAVLVVAGAVTAAILLGVILGMFAVIGMAVGLGALLSRPAEPSIVMTPVGLRLRTARGWFALPYDAVLDIESHERALVFTVPPPYGRVAVEVAGPLHGGLGADDRAVLIGQVRAAALRARGLGPHKEDASARVDVLRRNGESARDWLVRLDMAGRLLATPAGYRGNTLDVEDLWQILEDPEADAELRAAAARVLRHTPREETRTRIEAALAAVREDWVDRRLRIAIRDDVDAATQELLELEAHEVEEAHHRRCTAPGTR